MSREVGDKGMALKVELRIKKLSRKGKERLVEKPDKVDALILACSPDLD